MMISLVISEAALEKIPFNILHHPSVTVHARKLGKKPPETLLDRSYHHAAMQSSKLEFAWKRGRPDLVHFALIEALSTPLFLNHLLQVYVSTPGNQVIHIGKNLRIPKSYSRFEGLIIDLFKNNHIKDEKSEVTLLKLLNNVSLGSLINDIIKPSKVIGLSRFGIQSSPEDVVSSHINKDFYQCAFIVGGFPRGHFTEDTIRLCDFIYSIGNYSLEAHVVIARILYECEKVLEVN
ncbi:MAG TPA: ribosome biogenesis protein [Nitrososphaeraceae archaeon]